MSDAEAAPPPKPPLPLWVKIALPALALVFFGAGLHRSNRSTLRGDEIMTMLRFWRVAGIGHTILRGAGHQVSPAPLMYVIDTLADRSRARLDYLGLSPSGYVRLPSLLFTAGLGLAAAFVVARKIRGGTPLQFALVLCGLATFYFHPKVFAFACTERPYGLWNGLWFFLLAWLLGRPPAPKVPLILLCLLAATATASCFQILAIGIALVIVHFRERRPFKETLKTGTLLLALPAAIGLYYALRSVDSPYEELTYAEKVPHFLKFWLLSNLHVWIAGGAMTFLALRRPALRELAIPPLATLALIVVMPLIFTLSHMKGYTMVSRQYIWTSTAVPLAMFFTAVAWPELKPSRYLQAVAAVAALAISVGNIVATARTPLRNDSRELALLRPGSELMDYLKTSRPKAFNVFCDDDVDAENARLIEEWVRIRYASKPVGNLEFSIRRKDGALVAEATPPWRVDYDKPR